MGFCSGLSAGYFDLSPTSGSACGPFFFFFFFFNNMGDERLERRSAIMATY